MSARGHLGAVGMMAACVIIPTAARGDWQRFQSARDGLADNLVFSIFEDHRGQMWFGTANGVSAYDGLRWQTYRDELPNRSVNAIAEDADGRLWFGTQNGGVVSFDGRDWVTYSAQDGYLPSNQVQAIIADHLGELWFGTPAGLVRHDPRAGSWHTYSPQDGSIVHPFANALVEDAGGNLWVGTPHGASRFDATRSVWDDFPQNDNALARDSVLAVGAEPSGAVWFGTDQGAFRFDGSSWQRFTKAGSGLLDDVVTNLLMDHRGSVWCGGFFSLSRYDGTTWRSWLRTPEGFLNRILALAEDRSGNVWVATQGSGTTGLYRFDRTEWEQVRPWDLSQQISPNFTDFIEDSAGEMWFATDGHGLYRQDQFGRCAPQTSQVVCGAQVIGLPAFATTLLEDRDRNLWIGSSDGGVVRADPSRTSIVNFPPGILSGSNVRALTEDTNGRVWVGTEAGANRYEDGSWTHYLDGTNGLGPFLVAGILEDLSQVMWFRTSDRLYRLDDPGSVPMRVSTAQGLANDEVLTFLAARNGDVWFGTKNGLSRFDGAQWTTWPYLVEPSDTTMNALLEAHDGSIWVGSIRGASRFTGGQWEHFDRNVLGTENVVALFEDDLGTMWLSGKFTGLIRWNGVSWRTYGTADGLTSNLVTRIIEDHRGSLWFGSYAGLTEHRPDRTAPQTVFITTPAPLWGSRNASFVYGGAYGESADLEFRAFLDGLNLEDWSAGVSRDLVGLPDGLHTFEVESRDWSHNVDTTRATYRFEVDATPPTAVLSSPVFGQPVHGVIDVVGVAADPRFASLRLDYRPAGETSAGQLLVASSTPVTYGIIKTWDTRPIPDGLYDLRLSVIDNLGLTGISQVRVQVDNVAPFANVTSPVTLSAALGGDVYSTSGAAHLYFPPRAFDKDTLVDLFALTVSSGSGWPAGVQPLDPAYEVDWGSEGPRKAAVLDLALPDTLRTETNAAIYRQENGQWQRLGGTISRGVLSAGIPGPGTYALTIEQNPTPADGSSPEALSLTPRVFSPSGSFASTSVAISFTLGAPGDVRVQVFNRAGRLVATVADAFMTAGSNLVRWDGRGRDGDWVEGGLYVVAVEAQDQTLKQTLAVVR